MMRLDEKEELAKTKKTDIQRHEAHRGSKERRERQGATVCVRREWSNEGEGEVKGVTVLGRRANGEGYGGERWKRNEDAEDSSRWKIPNEEAHYRSNRKKRKMEAENLRGRWKKKLKATAPTTLKTREQKRNGGRRRCMENRKISRIYPN